MTETRDFPIAVIATLSTGIVLDDFAKAHECASYLMGWPIYTHHFADKELQQEMKRTILEQCPGLPTEAPDVDRSNYRQYVARLEKEFGSTVKIRKGSGLTAMLPTDGINQDKIIMVQVTS